MKVHLHNRKLPHLSGKKKKFFLTYEDNQVTWAKNEIKIWIMINDVQAF